MNQLRSVLVASLAASAAAYAPSALAGMPATSGTARPAAAAAAAAQPSPSRAVRAGGPVCQMRRGRQMRKPPAPKDNTPINEAIAFDEMRVLVDVPGGSDEMLGVMPKADALAAAEERQLDLVLIADKSEPVICKIVSYDKFRFNKEKKKKEQAKAVKGQELKELKMSYKIGAHDFDVRLRSAQRFLKQGNKVKFSMLFRGREIVHSAVGKEIMERMATALDDHGVLDSSPRVFGRQMIMTVGPKTKEAMAAAAAKKENS
mmetsp:Transcript_15013/g.48216  ORF Transcript_15013/g.48216 Transcript_15013/m.48216 type:complete len:260 (-) Transcript_15013:81-860(-)